MRYKHGGVGRRLLLAIRDVFMRMVVVVYGMRALQRKHRDWRIGQVRAVDTYLTS